MIIPKPIPYTRVYSFSKNFWNKKNTLKIIKNYKFINKNLLIMKYFIYKNL